MKKTVLLIFLLPALALAAEESHDVEDNIRAMDTDRDGQVSVSEVRAYLETKHGKGYEQDMMDEWETRAGTKSCGSPFSRSTF